MTKQKLKYLSSLKQKKYREQEKKFLAEGKKIVDEGINSRYKCEEFFYTRMFADKEDDFIQQVKAAGIKTDVLKNEEFNKLTDTVTPQGCAALFTIPPKPPFPSGRIVTVLDNISDPGNLGTIIRTCDWFGINEVILSGGCAELYNPKTIRSTMGSLFHINITEDAEIQEFITNLKKQQYSTICAHLKGENIFTFIPSQKTAVIFANEANGPSQALLSAVDKTITIPKLGKAESLNVAGASAVILAQLTK